MSDPTGGEGSIGRPGDLDVLRAVTAGSAHEIRNPLQFIETYAEVVAELAAELENIASEAEGKVPAPMFDAVVESMLAASHQGSGQRHLTDLNLLVRESAEFAYHGRVGAPSAPRLEQLNFELDPDLPLVVMDSLRMSRAVVNLVTNALQALASDTAAVEPTVTVRTARSAQDVTVAVIDNGPGVPPDAQPRVFEPFFTGQSGRHHAGLGLTQVWDIVVSDHDGAITVERDGASGTIAKVTLPEASESG